MGAAAIVKLVMDIITGLIPAVTDIVQRGIAGEDVSHEWVMDHIPDDLRTKILDEVKTAARRDAGLPV
jgi:hypothetical protein